MSELSMMHARLDRFEARLEEQDDAIQELSAQIREATAMVRAGLWIIGGLWGVSVTALGLWLAYTGH